MCAGAAVKSAWSNRFCLSGTTTSESYWKSGGDLERAVDSERGKKWAKSNSVCSTVWHSRHVFRSALNKVNGDFPLHAWLYCKSLILAHFISVIFTLFSFHFFVLLFPSLWWLLFLLRLHISVFPCKLCYSLWPPNAAVFRSIQIKQTVFRAPFLVSVSCYSFNATTPHRYKIDIYITSHQFKNFIRILQ